MAFTQTLATWLAGPAGGWSPAALDEAALCFVDTAGCMLAGAGEPPPQRVRRAFGALAVPAEAALVGQGGRAPAPVAALVNGTAAHALDYDDTYEVPIAHLSAALVPAILALGEARDRSGADALDAYLAGIAVSVCLGRLMNPGHYATGWHATATLGGVTAASACARLLRLDAESARNALALATSLAGGSKRQFGTMAKPWHAGLAARAGVEAALLAEAGLDARDEPFVGRWSVHELLAGQSGADPEAALAGLGGPDPIAAAGPRRKPFPCCAATHQAIEAALALRDRVPADLAAIEVELPEIFDRNLQYPRPATGAEAKFSLEHCVACALVDGEVGLGHFRPAAVARGDIAATASRVVRSVRPASDAGGIGDGKAVTVALVDAAGRRVSEGREALPAMTPAAVEAKFRDCVAEGGAGDPEPLLAALRAFAAGGPVRALAARLESARLPRAAALRA